ncbi:hypothetical protein ACHAWU_001257 [Discostella pseudostelligera]|uniref:Sulfotransferase domain-containing protein n=1 Tax=Discostella pseudostelligera TaxID=259834 RepID=A0ABD3MG14_9STRA
MQVKSLSSATSLCQCRRRRRRRRRHHLIASLCPFVSITVTLACTAAFAAGSTALLCVLFLSGELSYGNLRPLLEIQQPYYPTSDGTVGQHWAPRSRGRVMRSTPTRDDDVNGPRIIENSLSAATTSSIDEGVVSSTWPTGVVWLMSFPNSGTSYTLHAIRELTNTTTATNYGLEGEIRDEESVPVFPGDSGLNGPYLELLPGRTTTLPKLILTKTHCGGYNTILDPTKYIISSRTFLRWCLTGKRGVYSSSRSSSFGATPSIESQPVHYHKDVVKRVVHLIRNPLDNVVARFHNERNKFVRMQDEEWLKEYPNNKRGFRKWCREIDDDSNALAESPWIDQDLVNAFDGVPCRAEFFRYIQWHNHAFTVTQLDLGVPSMVLHYEDYSTRYGEVTRELMNFLELKPVDVAEDLPEFIPHKVYSHYYYSKEQTRAIASLVKEYSMKTTWQYLERYFDEKEDVVLQTS